jgi:hypothetical protein
MDESRKQQVEGLVSHYQQLAESARRTATEQQATHDDQERLARSRRGDQLSASLPLLFQILGQRLPHVFRKVRVAGTEPDRTGHELTWVATLPLRALQVDVNEETAHVAWRLTIGEQATDWQTVDGMTVTDRQLEELIDLLADQQTWGRELVPRCSFGVYPPDGEDVAPQHKEPVPQSAGTTTV